MLTHTDTYKDFVYEVMLSHKKAVCCVEKRVNYDTYAPEGFGTVDCLVLAGDKMYVIDFKYGKGVAVSAEENSQMMLYALGAYLEYSLLYDFKTVEMVVVQPRLDSISRWEISMEGLLGWGESIKPIAALAFAGQGEFCSGEHCRWCSIKATCGERAKGFLELEKYNKAVPPTLDDNTVGLVLSKALGMSQWIKDLEEYAFNALMGGRPIAGWKIVEGRSNRVISDFDGAIAAMEAAGYDKAVLTINKPLTLTGYQELLGGKTKLTEVIGNFITKPKGSPTLVPSDDKRSVFSEGSAQDDFKEFKEEN
jgi:hypothetical protein